IRICKGTYGNTNVVLSSAISLRGGYSCDGGWNRTQAFGFLGFDAGFDGVNETRLQTTNCATPVVDVATGFSAGMIIDGLTIVGPARIHDNKILGGSGVGGTAQGVAGWGSVAIDGYGASLNFGNGAPIEHNWISGGSGSNSVTTNVTNPPVGSCGISLDWQNT